MRQPAQDDITMQLEVTTQWTFGFALIKRSGVQQAGTVYGICAIRELVRPVTRCKGDDEWNVSITPATVSTENESVASECDDVS